MPPLLELHQLRVTRGRTAILRGIDWRVDRGQHWAILGANGSGKTTLLKALTGYMPPSSGAIALLGRRYGACDWRELRLQVGVVTSAFAAAIPPAEVALDTVMSGKFAQLDLWHRVSRADRAAARRLLGRMGLGHLAAREWAYLSQGERQRVLIARALMARPGLLVLDEPCAGLDPVAREEFLRFVDRAAGGGGRMAPALVLVTHHVEEVTPVYTHALLLRAGEVVAAGPRARVLTSANLSAAFDAPLRLARASGRYRLALARA
jgi:iron complex transport system ATP-binding protein